MQRLIIELLGCAWDNTLGAAGYLGIYTEYLWWHFAQILTFAM